MVLKVSFTFTVKLINIYQNAASRKRDGPGAFAAVFGAGKTAAAGPRGRAAAGAATPASRTHRVPATGGRPERKRRLRVFELPRKGCEP